ncbi:MAG TPA: FmdB family zinc ribbon protein [Solirubrobacterales bacterium]|nr:FmdB family zinc ribbon protein [Solirubrobacterales bacterium]
MPIYEYKCDNGHVFDVMQKMSEEPLTECVECGAPAHRVLTAPAVHFKGSGFYNTDYGKRKGAGNGSGGGESSSSESKSSSSSDSGSSSSDSGSKSDSKAAASSSSSSSD